MAEPSTAAGRQMLDNHLYWGEWYQHNWLAAILAIEAEARAAALPSHYIITVEGSGKKVLEFAFSPGNGIEWVSGMDAPPLVLLTRVAVTPVPKKDELAGVLSG